MNVKGLRKGGSRDSGGKQSPETLLPLEIRFSQHQSNLNARRRQLIRSILDDPEETYFLSSRALAKRYGVDAATIVRTIQALGYERFADFAADLRRHFVTGITPYSVMKTETRDKRSIADHVLYSVGRDLENLTALRSTMDVSRVLELAKLIHESRRILVIGVDMAASLAWFLAYGLLPLGFDAEAPTGSAGHLQHKTRLLTSRDLLIAISFGRCLRQTVEAVQHARKRAVPTFGITDSETTPIARHCDGHLIASVASGSFTGSYASPMALLNSILVACAHIKPKRSLALLRQSEEEYETDARWYRESSERGVFQRNGQAARRLTGKAKRKSKPPTKV